MHLTRFEPVIGTQSDNRRRRAALRAATALMTAAIWLCDGRAAESEPVIRLAPSRTPTVMIQYESVNAGDPQIRSRLDGEDIAIAGAPLNQRLLWHLYAAHGFNQIWVARPQQAASLWSAILHADEHGLDPNAFHASLIANVTTPQDRDLLLSDALLAYADALARGAVPVEKRRRTQSLAPEPVDVVAALEAAILSADPASALNALAPNTPAYLQLRQAYRFYRSAANTERARRIAVNLERLRWLPRAMPPDRVEVNTANAQLQLFRGNAPVFTTRVVVGQPNMQTPEFQATIDSILFNPPWYVPPSIAAKEILPKLSADPGYLARHDMVMRSNGSIVQLAGSHSSLGQLKFEMPNPYDVYLHDTPLKALFGRDNRRQSHGCVRVQNPRELAALLLQEPVSAVDDDIATDDTRRQSLPIPVPVFIVYQTVVAGPGDVVDVVPDVYRRDDEIWNRLHELIAMAEQQVHLAAPSSNSSM